jgi:hypothetical protein
MLPGKWLSIWLWKSGTSPKNNLNISRYMCVQPLDPNPTK